MTILPTETFRLQVDPGPDYFVVHLAPTLDAMRAEMQRTVKFSYTDQIAACVAGESDDHCLVGVLFFAENHFDIGIVAHELSHAAFRVMDKRNQMVSHWRKQRNVVNGLSTYEVHQTEEDYGYVVEQLTQSFWSALYDHQRTTEAWSATGS